MCITYVLLLQSLTADAFRTSEALWMQFVNFKVVTKYTDKETKNRTFQFEQFQIRLQ